MLLSTAYFYNNTACDTLDVNCGGTQPLKDNVAVRETKRQLLSTNRVRKLRAA